MADSSSNLPYHRAPPPQFEQKSVPPLSKTLEIDSELPRADFEALGDDNSRVPPDTFGAASPEHLMITLNTQVRIQHRDGTNISTVSLQAFWAPLSPTLAFDPRVEYDKVYRRWITCCTANPRATNSALFLAVSQTSDPTGEWHFYSIKGDEDLPPTLWADYPSLGYNKNWIVVSINMFNLSNDAFRFGRVWVIEKVKAYRGILAYHVTDVSAFTITPAVTHDKLQETLFLTDTSFSNTQVRISTVTGPTSQPTLNFGTLLSTPAQAPWGTTGGVFGQQLGLSERIDCGDNRMSTCVYRNGFVWCGCTAFQGERAYLQYWQLNSQTGAVVQFNTIEDPVISYAYSKFDVNFQNDMLIGYTVFNPEAYASAAYSMRFNTDPENTIRRPFIYKEGLAPYFKTLGKNRNRWGDYSNTVVDPKDDYSFFTIQQFADEPFSNGVSKWNTWWASVFPTFTVERFDIPGPTATPAPESDTVPPNTIVSLTVIALITAGIVAAIFVLGSAGIIFGF